MLFWPGKSDGDVSNLQVFYSQEDPVVWTCSNTVMVMTKEEMKREIRAQVADVFGFQVAPYTL